MPSIAILAQGAMGAGIGRRLAQRGCTVLTSLAGRSEASARRSMDAGMSDASPAELAGADFFLSVLPPAEAQATAAWLAPALAAAPHKATYADCNAISPRTALVVASIIAPTGASFIDGGIIGGPPREDGYTPVLYVAGDDAGRLMQLNDHGLDVRLTPGGIGAASALKMSYAGITKGLTALASAMILAAGRNGAAEGLRAELERSQPQLLAWLSRSVPPMYDKAYRWVGEMEEIADFTGPEAAAIYEGIAGFYGTMAADNAGPKEAVATLAAFIRKG